VVTRRKTDGSVETVVSPDPAGRKGLLRVHQTAIDALER
jgi:hypothetical protein